MICDNMRIVIERILSSDDDDQGCCRIDVKDLTCERSRLARYQEDPVCIE